MKPHRDDIQMAQRLRVGAIGLVVVIVLIALAGWIIDSTARDPATNGMTEIAVNIAADNAAAAGEPLAEMGAAPGGVNEQVDSGR